MIQTLINLLIGDIKDRAKADSSTTAENIGVGQHDAKPHVIGSEPCFVCGAPSVKCYRYAGTVRYHYVCKAHLR